MIAALQCGTYLLIRKGHTSVSGKETLVSVSDAFLLMMQSVLGKRKSMTHTKIFFNMEIMILHIVVHLNVHYTSN